MLYFRLSPIGGSLGTTPDLTDYSIDPDAA
jgi:hypothetical protein